MGNPEVASGTQDDGPADAALLALGLEGSWSCGAEPPPLWLEPRSEEW